MSKLRFKISMSLDGFCYPEPEREEPAGDGRHAPAPVSVPTRGVSCTL